MKVDDIVGGKYRIDQEIGAGGWSTIYRATHVELKTPVAIKVLDKQLAAQPRAFERFKQEAEIVCLWHHRNIVPVRDFGTTPDDEPYLVMDYIDGPSLDKLIKDSGPLPYRRAMPIFTQCCTALQFAHTHGVLHRDIKPGNVLLRSTPDDGQIAMISDFGLARGLGDTNPNITQTGETVGTPHYMSPELCAGRVADARSDIYSFGCLMYEALTGTKPFDSEHLVLIVDKHLNQPPPSFRKAAPQLKIPGRIEHIVLACLQKRPDDRFGSFDELQRAIDRTLNQPLLSDVDSLKFSLMQGIRSRAMLPVAVAVVFLAAIGVFISHGTGLTGPAPSPNVTDQAAHIKAPSEKKPKYYQGPMTMDWLNRLDNARRNEDYVSAAQACTELVKAISDFPASSSGADSLIGLSQSLLRLSRFKDAQPVLEQTVSFTSGLGPDASLVGSEAKYSLAFDMAALGNTAKADSLLKEALQDTRKTYNTRHPNYALALQMVGETNHQSKRYKKAAEAFQQAISILSKTSEITDPVMVELHIWLGRSLGADGQYAVAASGLKELLNALDKSQAASDKSRIWALLGEIAERQGDAARAQECLETAIKTQEASGKVTPEYANLLAHYAHFMKNRNHREAQPALAKAEKFDRLMSRPVYDNLLDPEPAPPS